MYIRRRTRVVGSFPDGNSALMLVCARLRHVAGTQYVSRPSAHDMSAGRDFFDGLGRLPYREPPVGI